MVSNLPKITIITPSFNQGNYIEQTIQSVLEQGYPNLEYIIIDGGSTDDTVDIIRRYESQIKFWVSEPDKGQTDAINKGFQKATGDIINWLNSDDYYAKDTFVNLAASFGNQQLNAVTSVVHNFDESGSEWNEITEQRTTNIEYLTRALNNQPGTFFRKEVWEKYFPIPEQLRYTMDQYLWFCYWIEHTNDSFKIENYTSVFFRRHASSKTAASLADTVFNYLGKIFFNEHTLIFWSFFKERDIKKAEIIASYFWDGYDFELKKVSFPANLQVIDSQLEKLFQFYLFGLLKEDFRHGFFQRLKANIKSLDPAFFTSAERKTIQKLKLSAINPKAVQTYRRLYWKTKNRH